MSKSAAQSLDENILMELNDKQKSIIEYLLTLAEKNDGETYVRSRNIAEELGFSSREVGANLNLARKKVQCISVEKWGRSNSTTWKIERT